MKIKLKYLKKQTGDIFAEAIIKDKVIIKIKSLNDKYLDAGKPFNVDFRSKYDLVFLNKYEKGYEYGDVIIKFKATSDFSYEAVVVANFFQRMYLKLLFNQYFIQRIDGGVRTAFEIIAFIITTIITWYASKC
ncbi:MAG: hypothetical protein RLZZ540_1071 [Bacteroidota bacterium]|jgi:hypothetical protein